MATRMQQRRGTAAQWTSANPILNAGEMGWESDTNKFKIGDGTNHWANLDYFIDQSSTVNPSFGSSITFEGATADSYETTLQVTDPTADRTITFPDATGTVALTSDIAELSQDAIDSALTAGTGITKTYNDAANTLTLAVDTTTIQARVADVSDTEIGYLNGVTSAIQTQLDSKAASADITELAQDAVNTALTAGTGITKTYDDSANTITIAVDTTAIQAKVSGVSDTEIGYLDGVTSAIQTQLDAKSTASKTETLSNKSISLTSNTLTGTTAEFNTALSDSNFVTTGDTGTVTSTMIADGTIVNGDINASAAIAYSKLNLSGSITSSDITNGTIVNEDINASAAIALSKLATDPLARANHTGTQTASTISDFDTQVRTSKVTDLAAPTSSFSMNSQKITSLATPTSDADAATKAYVDAATAGLNVHAAVQAATTANITLASALENGDTLDGVTLATGNRVLVKNQTDKTQNGVYVVKASGAPDRATDYDSTLEVDAGDFIFVEAGTVNGKTGWVQTNVITTIGSDNIEFTQFSGAGTYTAGNGLTLTGSTFAIDTAITQTRVSGVSDTEIGYLDGVTSAIQTQIDSKLASSTASSTYAPLASPTFTGTVTIPNGAGLGTPTTLTLTNATGLPVSTGISGLGTGIATALAVNTGSAGAPVLFNGALGTPSSGTLTNATGLPISGLTSSTTTALGVGSIELGHATDTTIARSSAGVVTIEGVVVDTISAANTLSNKTLASAVATTALTLNATAELRLADTDSSHYVGFKAPGTVTTNRIWTLPAADGTSGQTLSTDGSGALSWSTPAAGAAFSEMMLIGA